MVSLKSSRDPLTNIIENFDRNLILKREKKTLLQMINIWTYGKAKSEIRMIGVNEKF